MNEASDRELLIRIDERLQGVKSDLKDVKEWYRAADGRLHKLEGWQKKLVGIAIGIGAASGAGASALWKAITGTGLSH